MIEPCGNTIAPVENAGRWGACQLRPGHYGDCIEVSGRDSTRLLAYERSKQIMRYRYDSAHDDSIGIEAIINAASAYIWESQYPGSYGSYDDGIVTTLNAPASWPWSDEAWHPEVTVKENLVKAGALILAALDHITREEERNATR